MYAILSTMFALVPTFPGWNEVAASAPSVVAVNHGDEEDPFSWFKPVWRYAGYNAKMRYTVVPPWDDPQTDTGRERLRSRAFGKRVARPVIFSLAGYREGKDTSTYARVAAGIQMCAPEGAIVVFLCPPNWEVGEDTARSLPLWPLNLDVGRMPGVEFGVEDFLTAVYSEVQADPSFSIEGSVVAGGYKSTAAVIAVSLQRPRLPYTGYFIEEPQSSFVFEGLDVSNARGKRYVFAEFPPELSFVPKEIAAQLRGADVVIPIGDVSLPDHERAAYEWLLSNKSVNAGRQAIADVRRLQYERAIARAKDKTP